MDDESEKLLSALTEMLDTVEDDDGNLSPFDTLPDTELLDYQTTGSSDVGERLQPKPSHELMSVFFSSCCLFSIEIIT